MRLACKHHRHWLVIVCILLDFCLIASFVSPSPGTSALPPIDGGQDRPISALPIAAPDSTCTDAHHCSQEYHATTVANQPVLLSWLTVLDESCQTESECNTIMSEPITVVVGVYSRPGTFADITSAILNSSANVTRLWIVCNGSPYIEMFQELTLQLKARVEADPAYRHVKVDFFGATLETGYFERFTRVLLAETKFVAVVDDDVVVAPRYLEICLRAASIKRFQGLIGAASSSRIYSQCSPKIELNFSELSAGANDGLLGIRPRIMPNPSQDARSPMCNSRDELESHTCERRAPRDSAVDVLFSPYFGSTDLMQSIFADKLWTMKTGEDITLAYSVRHHAKVPVLIFDDGDDYQGELVHLKPLFSANLAPFLAGLNRTWSCINTEGSCGDDNFVQMVATEDRRRGYMVNDKLLKGSESQHVLMRRRLQYHLWQQGWTLTTTRFFLEREGDRENAMLGRKHESFCSDLLFVASHAQALAVKTQVLHLLEPQKSTSCDFEGNTCVVLLGVDREAVDKELGITENRRFLDMRLLDLHLDDEVGAESFPRLFARVMLKLQSVLEAVQPSRLWILEDGTIPSAAAAVCGGMLHIPVRLLNVPKEEHGRNGVGQGQAKSHGSGSPQSLSSMVIEMMGRFQRQEPVPESEVGGGMEFH
jgi:hypothetical protein